MPTKQACTNHLKPKFMQSNIFHVYSSISRQSHSGNTTAEPIINKKIDTEAESQGRHISHKKPPAPCHNRRMWAKQITRISPKNPEFSTVLQETSNNKPRASKAIQK